jgi:CheY-like chemotaxis protein
MDKKNSVLVVDDEPHGFDVIEAHLYREGYTLTYVSSGIEALTGLMPLNLMSSC